MAHNSLLRSLLITTFYFVLGITYVAATHVDIYVIAIRSLECTYDIERLSQELSVASSKQNLEKSVVI